MTWHWVNWTTTVAVERILLQIVILYFLIRGFRAINLLLRIGQLDRIARERALAELQRSADALSKQTADIAERVHARETQSTEKIHEQLVIIDQKVDVNTEMTRQAANASATAASASATAAEIANHVNEKIVSTNETIATLLKEKPNAG